MRISSPIAASLVPALTARLRDDGTLVDLAAGDGELIAAVAAVRPSATLLAYERDATLVAAARARQIQRATIALFDLSLDRPPPARGRVDVVVSPFVLGAQPEDSALLTHLRRLLREGGLLVAIEPDEPTAQRVSELLARRGFVIESIDPADDRHVVVYATPDLSRVGIGGIRGWDTGERAG